MKLSSCLLIFFFIGLRVGAQADHRGFSIGANPFSLLEPLTTFGPATSLRLSEKFSLWSEEALIFRNDYWLGIGKKAAGFRLLIQPRYFFDKYRRFFVAPEFRLKTARINNSVNASNGIETLYGVAVSEKQVFAGGALLAGVEIEMNKRENFYLEITAGIGQKNRQIRYRNLPAGYQRIDNERTIEPAFQLGLEIPGSTVYFPDAIRLMWRLNYRAARAPRASPFNVSDHP